MATNVQSLRGGDQARQILLATQATGRSFQFAAGTYHVWVNGHAGGTWVLQMDDGESGWIDTAVTFGGDEISRVNLLERSHRLTGGTTGATAWIQRYDPPEAW